MGRSICLVWTESCLPPQEFICWNPKPQQLYTVTEPSPRRADPLSSPSIPLCLCKTLPSSKLACFKTTPEIEQFVYQLKHPCHFASTQRGFYISSSSASPALRWHDSLLTNVWFEEICITSKLKHEERLLGSLMLFWVHRASATLFYHCFTDEQPKALLHSRGWGAGNEDSELPSMAQQPGNWLLGGVQRWGLGVWGNLAV